MKRK
jgi:hypothetical protein